MIPVGNNVLAIEWDRSELRYVWVAHTGRRIVIRNMGRMVVPDSTPGQTPYELLSDLKVLLRAKNAQVIVCLARSDVDEFEAILPPADDHEMGPLVTNEAHKHLPAIGDEARIDYFTIEHSADLTRRVAIAVLAGERYRQIAASIKQQSWKLASLQLRHVATAQLLRRLIDLSAFPRSILLSVSGSDADLIVLEKDQMVLVRTIPLSTDFEKDSLGEKLAVEIQRSLMVTARPDHEEVSSGEQIFLFGSDAEQQSLIQQLSAALSATVTLVNPLQPFVSRDKAVPARLHQFAGLFGSILDQPRHQMIDLQSTKCVKPISSWRQRSIFYGAVAGVFLIALVAGARNSLTQLSRNNAALKQKIAQAQKTTDEMSERMMVVDKVEEWHHDDVNWLDELQELSHRFPERSKVQVKSMTLSSGSISDGVISMNLRAKDDTVISQLEQAVRDGFHQVRTNQLSQDESDVEFPWQFGATILLQRRERDEYSPAQIQDGAASKPVAPGESNPPQSSADATPEGNQP